jgi:hypothetical protein
MRKIPAKSTDDKAAWKHRVYCDPKLWNFFRQSAEALGKSPSALLTETVARELRRKAVKLRKAGVKLPEEVLA